MFYHLSKLRDYEFSEYDDPTSFAIYTNQDLSKKKMFGLDYVGVCDDLKRDDLKKVKISKESIIMLIAFYGLIILSLFLD